MSEMKSARIQDHFAELTDARRRDVIYPLIDVVVIEVWAVICGANDRVAMAECGRKKQKWATRFLDLKSRIRSHDQFNAILAAIKPTECEKCTLLDPASATQVAEFVRAEATNAIFGSRHPTRPPPHQSRSLYRCLGPQPFTPTDAQLRNTLLPATSWTFVPRPTTTVVRA